jgi:hypothetical protein
MLTGHHHGRDTQYMTIMGDDFMLSIAQLCLQVCMCGAGQTRDVENIISSQILKHHASCLVKPSKGIPKHGWDHILGTTI